MTVKYEQKLTEFGVVQDKPRQKLDVIHLDRGTGMHLSDVSIGHPAADSYVRAASKTDGWVIARAERSKNTKYKQKVEAAGWHFHPLIGETEGRWSEAVARLLRDLARLVAETAENNSTFVRNRMVDRGWKDLACTLQKFNAYMILSRSVANAHTPPVPYRTLGLGGGLQEYFVPDWV
jgi:hypothetical protein